MKVINRYLKEERDYSQQDSVKAILFRGDYLLIIRRQDNGPGAGNWDIPGGHIEKGENKVDALKREVFEETGLEIDNEKFLKTIHLKIPKHGINSNMNIYTADSTSVDVTLKPATWEGSDGKCEHTEYKWIEYKYQMENLPMIEPLKNVIIDQLKN